VLTVVFAFACGVSVGLLIGRRSVRVKEEREAVDRALPVRPTKRASKKGLTPESFQPSDDILERLRKAAEGELDPAVLRDAGGSEPAPAPPTPEELHLSEAERRVLERLRRQAEGGDTGFS
jgi:hypothetical protein